MHVEPDMVMRSPGFTLIELMVALAIFGILLMLAGPAYTQFMANHQIRNATDAMLNGVQRAQATAVRDNSLARLVVDTTTGTGGWQVLETIDGTESTTPVQVFSVKDGAPAATMTTVPGDARQVTFDGFGRLVVPNADGSATLTCIKVSHPVTGSRPLNVAISIGVKASVKLCDPALTADTPTEPLSCPSQCQ